MANQSKLNLYARDYVKCTDYDAVWVSNGARLYLETPLISGFDQGVELSNASAVIRAGQIHGDSNAIEFVASNYDVRADRFTTFGTVGARLGGTGYIDVKTVSGQLEFNTGNVRVLNAYVDGNTLPAVYLKANGLTLENCNLSSSTTYSVSGNATARRLGIIGTVNTNKGYHISTVTPSGGFFITSGNITNSPIFKGGIATPAVASVADAYSINVDTAELWDNFPDVSLNWSLGRLYDLGSVTLDWRNRYLSGTWTAQDLVVSGGRVVNSSQTGDFYPRSNPSGYISSFTGGGITAAANIGAGSGIYSGVTGGVIQLKSLKTGNGINISGSSTELMINVNLTYASIPFTGGLTGVPAGQWADLIQTGVPRGVWQVMATTCVGSTIEGGNFAIKIYNGDKAANHVAWAIGQGNVPGAQVQAYCAGIANITNPTGSKIVFAVGPDPSYSTQLSVDATLGVMSSGIGTNGSSGISPTQLTLVKIG